MTTVKELREKRAGIWAQAQEFDTRKKAGDTMSVEDEAAWARALDDVDKLGAEIELMERTSVLDSKFAEIDDEQRSKANDHARDGGGDGGSIDAYRATFQKWCRFGVTHLDTDERAMLEANFRALGEGTGSAGGYTVPEGFWAKVTETMKYYGGAFEGAEIITTATGNNLPWSTNDDTASEGYQLGENTAATNEGDLTFGTKTLGNYTYVSGPALVSLQLIQDSGIDIEAFVARKMGQRLGRIKNKRLTTGTGSSQPQGFITGATTGKTTAGATAITYNEIVDLIHSVDAAYRAMPGCQFKMHDLVLAYVRKIRDDSGGSGLGRPIWEPSAQVGVPDSLLGYRVTVNNDMASSVATTNKTIAFGHFGSAFVIRNVAGGQMMQLRERYAEYLQVGFLGYERWDSLVQDASAVKVMVQA